MPPEPGGKLRVGLVWIHASLGEPFESERKIERCAVKATPFTSKNTRIAA